MPAENNEFYHGVHYNFLQDGFLTDSTSTHVSPEGEGFLLLDGGSFLLLSGEDFDLLS